MFLVTLCFGRSLRADVLFEGAVGADVAHQGRAVRRQPAVGETCGGGEHHRHHTLTHTHTDYTRNLYTRDLLDSVVWSCSTVQCVEPEDTQ